MPTEKRYTIGQLRGAYVAGLKGKDASMSTKRPRLATATQRAMAWMEQGLLRLAEQHGPAMAFSRRRKGSDWVLIPIANLYDSGGGEREVDEVFERVIGRLVEKHADNPKAVSHAEDCLERWLEEWKCNMDRAIREGSRVGTTQSSTTGLHDYF